MKFKNPNLTRTLFLSGKNVQRISKAVFALGMLAIVPETMIAAASASVVMPQSVGVSITGPSSFCPGSSATLTANVTGCSGSTSFVWKRNGVFMPGAITASIVVTNPGDYTVAATCSGQTGTSSVFTLSRLTLKTNVQNACPGSTGNVNLIVQNGTAPFSYLWNNGQTSQDLIGVPSGIYSVVATDANGCSATTSASVQNTIVNVSAGPNKSVCAGGSVQLQATGADNYKWTPAATLDKDYVANPMATPGSTTVYTVTGYVNSGDLVNNGSFNQGNVGFASDYAFVNGFAVGGYSSGTGLYPEGKYSVIPNRTDTNVTKMHPSFKGVGHNKGLAAGENDDYYMAINGSSTQGQIVWSQSVEVLPNTNYNFTTWIASINLGNLSKLRFKINNDVLGQQIVAPSSLNTWSQFFTTWNSGTSTNATISIINDNLATGGNDFGLDDISFSVSCMATSEVTVTYLPALTGNTITCPPVTTFCLSGDAAEFVGSIPTGGNGTFTYQWEVSDDNQGFSPIDGATSINYNPGPVSATTYFRRKAMSGDCSIISNVCTITIQGSIANNVLTSPSPSSFCASGNPGNIVGTNLNEGLTTPGGNTTYMWEYATDGNEWYPIEGANGSSYDPATINTTTSYRRVARRGNCSSGASNVITFTVNPLPVITIPAPAQRCGPGTLSLEANASGTIKWYSASQGGVSLLTGSIYTAIDLQETTSFYVEASNLGCTSTRIEVPATINARPTIISTTPGFRCGAGNASVSAVASAGDVKWFADLAGSFALGSGNSISVPVTGATTVYALANNGGCTSVETTPIAITIGENTTADVYVTECNSYTWALNGQTYTSSGSYYYSSTNASGCVLTTTLNLTINTSSTVTLNVSINQGEVYAFNGQNLTTGGQYIMNSTGANGCPMVTTLNLTVVPTPQTGSCYAEEVISFNQKKRNDGTYVISQRSIPSRALGAPQASDVATSEANNNFVSLGFGGDITLKFGSAIKNGAGNDVRVVETSFGTPSCSRYPEKIRAYASQDGCNFVYMGEGCQDTDFDLGSLAWAQYIKIVDISNPNAVYQGTPVADGYDLDGIICLNGSESNPVIATATPGANSVISYAPGLCKNSSNVPVSRRNPANALGLPQGTDVVNFVSLGFGGTLTLKYNYVIFDNPTANDIQVVETSYGAPSCNTYPERAQFEGSLDGTNWTYIGELCQDGQLDINAAGVIQYIRITDRSLASNFSGAADGYDVDGLVVINKTCGSNALRNAADLIVDVTTTPDEETVGNLYPNPATDIAILSVDGAKANETWTVQVVDIAGRLVSTSSFITTEGITEHRIQVSDLASGIYQVIATNGSNKIVQKMTH